MDFKQEIEIECSHDSNKSADDFCSPIEIVEKLKEFGGSKDEILEKTNCETEVCILNHPEVQKIIEPIMSVENILTNYFKPEGPRESEDWFSNTDIDSVLDQIQEKYTEKHFLHIPFQMIDFEKTGSELARLDWPAKYKEGFRTFGTVFNTDLSTGRGQHWFAVYGSFEDSDPDHTLEFFNSSGELPQRQLQEWLHKVKNKWQSKFEKPIKIVIATRVENQQDDFSCGSYALYYIISRLAGIPYRYFKDTKLKDSDMVEYRKFLFRPLD